MAKKKAPAKDPINEVTEDFIEDSETAEDSETTEEIENPEPLPKGITSQLYEQAKDIIISGFQAGQSTDIIKSEIFKLGVPFSKLNAIFNKIAKDENLIADPKEVKAGIIEYIDSTDIDFDNDSYEDLLTIANTIAGNVDGATSAKVMAQLKTVFKENEKVFPKKPKGTGTRKAGLGAISKALIDLYAENSNPTPTEVYNVILPTVKGPENAIYYTKQYFVLLTAVKNGATSEQASKLQEAMKQ